ncbi:MAG: STAS/SEC14 domain-containing protein, partial [Gammaproteobacteria bacterium]|nr:STAS/SEC14 domain-containing protein [Gammaproteobacteria bacterium]
MSVITRKGLSIGISRVNEHVFVELRAIGKLTHEDYETMTPMLEEALSEVRHPTIDALVDIRELEGWEARAAWDDFKLGMKHRKEWNRIAVVG